MKFTLQTIAVSLLVGASLMGAPTPTVQAEDSAYRASINVASLRGALDGQSVPLLKVVPLKGGRTGQLEQLRRIIDSGLARRLQLQNPGKMRSSDRSLLLPATDGSWYVEVMGDGSVFRYRGNIDDQKEIDAAARFGRLDMATLERLGSEFITKQLAPLAPLADGERLVFLGARYLREGSASEENQKFTSEVVANIAVFGREVRGTYVAGPGSKIAVWFSNAGEPVGFDVDWPTYRVLPRTQKTLALGQVWERLFAYADSPQDLIKKNLSHFECGYVDLGGRKRGTTMLQAGCFALHDGPLGDDLKYASIEVIPIGEKVVRDTKWPVTRAIASKKPWDLCKVSKTACVEPPPADEQ
jgi:hypothetical protein